jgi:hypothetical protein
MPGERISQAHGTVRPVDPVSGAANALAFALYHPAAALRTPEIERTSYQDVAMLPAALLESRARRESPARQAAPGTVSGGASTTPIGAPTAADGARVVAAAAAVAVIDDSLELPNPVEIGPDADFTLF